MSHILRFSKSVNKLEVRKRCSCHSDEPISLVKLIIAVPHPQPTHLFRSLLFICKLFPLATEEKCVQWASLVQACREWEAANLLPDPLGHCSISLTHFPRYGWRNRTWHLQRNDNMIADGNVCMALRSDAVPMIQLLFHSIRKQWKCLLRVLNTYCPITDSKCYWAMKFKSHS